MNKELLEEKSPLCEDCNEDICVCEPEIEEETIYCPEPEEPECPGMVEIDEPEEWEEEYDD